MIALHEHNERAAAEQVGARLAQGQSVAYVSDAGTPAVSDPGAALVAASMNGGKFDNDLSKQDTMKLLSAEGRAAAIAAAAQLLGSGSGLAAKDGGPATTARAAGPAQDGQRLPLHQAPGRCGRGTSPG